MMTSMPGAAQEQTWAIRDNARRSCRFVGSKIESCTGLTVHCGCEYNPNYRVNITAASRRKPMNRVF